MAPDRPHLSPREQQVLCAVWDGLTTREISTRLQLSMKTVELYRHQVLLKFGRTTVAAMVASGLRYQYLTISAPPE